MKRPAAKRKITDLDRSRLVHRASGSSHSYLKTRVRASRLYEAAFILAFIELSRRLHQAYRQAYDKQAVDWLFPQNPAATPSPTPRELDCHGFADLVQMIADKSDGIKSFKDELASTFTGARNSSDSEMLHNSAGPSRVNTTDDGFRSELRESQDTHNQARHYVGGFIAGASLGEFFGRRFMNDRETPGLPDYASDTAMNRISTSHGSDFAGSAHGIDYLRRYLARRIRIEVCGDKR